MTEARDDQGRARPVAGALFAACAMILFAFFSHRGLPWIIVSGIGILAAAVAIQSSFSSAQDAVRILGLSAFPGKAVVHIAIACAIGLVLGILFRRSPAMPTILKGGMQPFAVIACLIGGTEEILFRGWVQGRLRVLGWPAAVILAAVAHTAYKMALFAWPPMAISIDFPLVGLCTLIVGILFGMTRELSGCVLPPILGHIGFDLIVYGAAAQTPWWIWM